MRLSYAWKPLLGLSYILTSLPLLVLVFISPYFRTTAVEECARKLSHVRALKYAALGDSHVASVGNWGPKLSFDPFSAVNLGVLGATIDDVTNALDGAARLHPKTLLIEVGGNDIRAGRTADQIVTSYQEMFQKAEQNGFRRIFVTSIPFMRDPEKDPLFSEMNRLLQLVVAEHSGVYVDLNALILSAKNRPDLYAQDGVHFTEEMYALWFRAIREALNSGRQGL